MLCKFLHRSPLLPTDPSAPSLTTLTRHNSGAGNITTRGSAAAVSGRLQPLVIRQFTFSIHLYFPLKLNNIGVLKFKENSLMRLSANLVYSSFISYPT